MQETLRQVRLVRDCAYCQRGWQGDTEYCRLKEGCFFFFAVWITGRGVSESPWIAIAGGSEHVRSTDVPQAVETDWIMLRNLQELCRVLSVFPTNIEFELVRGDFIRTGRFPAKPRLLH